MIPQQCCGKLLKHFQKHQSGEVIGPPADHYYSLGQNTQHRIATIIRKEYLNIYDEKIFKVGYIMEDGIFFQYVE